MPKNIISRGQANELVTKLETAGLTAELTQAVIQSPNNALALKLVSQLLRESGLGLVPDREINQALYGRQLGIFQAELRGIQFPSKHFYANRPITWLGLEEAVALGAWLIAVPPVSLASLASRFPNYFPYWSQIRDLRCVRESAQPGHYLIVPDATDSSVATIQEQLAQRPKKVDGWGLVSVSVLAYAAIIRHLQSGKSLLGGVVRTADWGYKEASHLSIFQDLDGRLYIDPQDDSTARSLLGAAYGRLLQP